MSVAVEVLLLAAGRSSRTGERHKLLAEFEGEAMVRRAARAALASRARSVTAVVGYRSDEIREALGGLPLRIVENPNFATGMASSLTLGFAARSEGIDGILVMLADQPQLAGRHLDRLIEAFSPEGHGSIIVATDRGRRFNPVLISSRYATDISMLQGDVGARSVVVAHEDCVREVELGQAASLDIDTPSAVAEAGGRLIR